MGRNKTHNHNNHSNDTDHHNDATAHRRIHKHSDDNHNNTNNTSKKMMLVNLPDAKVRLQDCYTLQLRPALGYVPCGMLSFKSFPNIQFGNVS